MKDMMDVLLKEFTPRIGRCCIAGGAVRDTLMKRPPKDYDLFCFEEFDQASVMDAKRAAELAKRIIEDEELTVDEEREFRLYAADVVPIRTLARSILATLWVACDENPPF